MITKMAFVAHPTRHMEASRKFYGEALRLTTEYASPSGKWVELATPDGATIALDAFTPETSEEAGPYLSLESDNIQADAARLKAAGAKMVRDVWSNEDAGGNDICHMALFLDPDGHSVMLHQMAAGRDG